jgi:hypothetical protein
MQRRALIAKGNNLPLKKERKKERKGSNHSDTDVKLAK